MATPADPASNGGATPSRVSRVIKLAACIEMLKRNPPRHISPSRVLYLIFMPEVHNANKGIRNKAKESYAIHCVIKNVCTAKENNSSSYSR